VWSCPYVVGPATISTSLTGILPTESALDTAKTRTFSERAVSRLGQNTAVAFATQPIDLGVDTPQPGRSAKGWAP